MAWTLNPLVVGSIPTRPTNTARAWREIAGPLSFLGPRLGTVFGRADVDVAASAMDVTYGADRWNRLRIITSLALISPAMISVVFAGAIVQANSRQPRDPLPGASGAGKPRAARIDPTPARDGTRRIHMEPGLRTEVLRQGGTQRGEALVVPTDWPLGRIDPNGNTARRRLRRPIDRNGHSNDRRLGRCLHQR